MKKEIETEGVGVDPSGDAPPDSLRAATDGVQLALGVADLPPNQQA